MQPTEDYGKSLCNSQQRQTKAHFLFGSKKVFMGLPGFNNNGVFEQDETWVLCILNILHLFTYNTHTHTHRHTKIKKKEEYFKYCLKY